MSTNGTVLIRTFDSICFVIATQGQVQQLLNPEGEDETRRDPETAPPTNPEDGLPRALPDVSMATMEELEKLGIHLHHGGDVTIDERSLYR